MTPSIRVLVVDDHDLARASVTGLLDDTDGIEVVGEAPDGREAAAVLAQRRCRARVLMFSAELRDEVIRNARVAGAAGFMAKGSRSVDVLRAIRTVHTGGTTWPSGV